MEKTECRVRYVANAGLLLSVGEEAIGIDVFCKDPEGLYADTPAKIREELLEEIRRGKLTTLIFTHGHGDHFHKESVLEAWNCNPGLCIISTEQVARELTEAGIPGAMSMGALRVKKLPSGLWAIPDGDREKKVRWISFGAVQIGFLNSLHEGEKYADVQNLTLLVDLGEQKAVVPGDAAAKAPFFERIAAWEPELDWFFLPFPYVGVRSARKLLAEKLVVRNAFVLHQPRPQADVQNWVGSAKRMCQRTKDGLPMPIFPDELGTWWSLSEANRK